MVSPYTCLSALLDSREVVQTLREGQPLSCHLVNWSSFMWAGAASAQGTAVGQATLMVIPH